MKFRFDQSSNADSQKAIFVADSETLASAFIAWAPPGSQFLDPNQVDELNPHGEFTTVVYLEDRADLLRDLLEKWLVREGNRVEAIREDDAAGLFFFLENFSDQFAVTSMDSASGIAKIRIERSGEHDAPLGAARDLAKLFANLGTLEAHPDPIADSEEEFRHRYLELLETLQLRPFEEQLIAETMASNQVETIVSAPVASAGNAELEKQIAQLQGKNESLERKYESLSKSKLGKVQLAYWQKRREMKRK